jgi:hypothetical protein
MKTLLVLLIATLAVAQVGRAVELSSAPCPPGGKADSRYDQYVLDDGTGETSIGLGGGGTLIWLNQFWVQPYDTDIGSVSVAWGDVPAGRRAEILIFDGWLNLLARMEVASEGGNNDTFYQYPIAAWIGGTQSFFVGVCCSHFGGEYPARLDQSSSMQQSWAGGDGALDFDCAFPDAGSVGWGLIDDYGYPGNWMIRACAVRPGGQCCNEICAVACCLPDDSCLMMSDSGCYSLGGQPMGAHSRCDPDPCAPPPPPLGACCGPDGSCVFSSEAECTTSDWRMDVPCDPNPCPPLPPPETCIDYREYLHPLGGADLPEIPYGVALAEGYAFVADGLGGLQVIDFTDPASIRIAGSVDTPGDARGVALSGTHAYVADGNAFEVIDISDPSAPVIVGSIDYEWFYQCSETVAVSGSYAYVTAAGCEILVIDISAPESPEIVAELWRSGSDVAVSGTQAYFATDTGLVVVDISDPRNPVERGSVATPEPARSVAVSGSFVYVADGESGLQVIDVTDPENPQIAASAPTGTPALEVAVAGGHCHVGESGKVEIFDVAAPGDPHIVNEIAMAGIACPGLDLLGSFGCVTFQDGDYPPYHGGVQLIDITSSQPAPILARILMPGLPPGDFAVSGDLAYATEKPNRLQVIDVSDPFAPQLLGRVDISGLIYRVAVSGNYACATGYWETPPYYDYQGVYILDVEDPQYPVLVTRLVTYDAGGVDVSGRYAYAAGLVPTGGSGLVVIDIGDPPNPEIVGGLSLPLQVLAIAVSGDYAYVGGGYPGKLYVVEISNSQSLRLAGEVELGQPGYAWDVAVDGGHAYVADIRGFLSIIDVTDPENPWLAGKVQVPDWVVRVDVRGSYAYLASSNYGVIAVDVTDPSNPELLGGATRFSSSCLAVVGECVLAGAAEGIQVLPVQCAVTGVAENRGSASILDLRAVPNPSRQGAAIGYTLPARGPVRAGIYDVGGRQVRGLQDGVLDAGLHSLFWDGQDNAGHEVAPGVYLARVSTVQGTRSARVVIVR